MRTIIMDSQILSTFQECPEKFNLNFIHNLRSAHPIPALVKGSVLHAGLEGYYRHLKAGLETEQSRNLIHNQAIEVAILDANVKAAENGIELESEAQEVITVLEEYFHFYKDDDLVPIAIEEPFVKVIYEDTQEGFRVLYAGKIDLVATASRYQWAAVPFDNKSSGRQSTPSGRSNQFFGYCDALDSNILVVNKIGFGKSLTPVERFKRHPLSYSREYRERWKLNTIRWAYKLAWALDEGIFEENLSSCDKWSGCTYKKICESATPEAKEWKIQSEFIVGEKWDPTKLLELKNDPNEKVIEAQPSESGGVRLLNSHAPNEGN